MKKGIGSKFAGLFVTSDENDSSTDVEELLRQQTEALGGIPVSENVVADVGNLMTIESIYQENNLEDKTKSIFKIDEIKSVLPANLPTEAKKASVVGMMGVSGLTLETVLADAEQRTSILNGALDKFTQETIKIVTDSETGIADLEAQINAYKETITARKKDQEDQEKLITDEVTKIKNITDFIK